MQLRKLSNNLQPRVASTLRELKHSVRLSSNVSVSKRGPFKWVHWALFKRASNYRWGQVSFKFLALSRDISACCEGIVAVLRQDYFQLLEIKPAQASISLVGKIQNILKI